MAVSHDRAFLQRMDRYLLVRHDGAVFSLPDYESALQAMLAPADAGDVRLAKRLSAARYRTAASSPHA